LKRYLIRYIFLLHLLVLAGSNIRAQKPLISGINFGAKAGASKLITEIPNDFSETINEFDNKAGLTFAPEISKYVFPRWELGFEWNTSVLKGETYSPSFSATGNHIKMMEPITEPVEYNNQLTSPGFFLRYYFKPVTRATMVNPFIRIGYGNLHYKSVFKYIDSGEVIFGKGEELGSTLNTPVFNLGTGIKTSITPQVYLMSTIDFNLVDYDFLDVVHNFDADGNRRELFGFYTEIKIGIYDNVYLFIYTTSSSTFSFLRLLPF
jgi:hypothetical protein